MPSCYIKTCRSGSKKEQSQNEEKIRYFQPRNREQFIKWKRVIGRRDKKLTMKHKLCHKHFNMRYFDRHYKIVIDGKTDILPRRVWRMSREAVPEFNLDKESTKPYLSTDVFENFDTSSNDSDKSITFF